MTSIGQERYPARGHQLSTEPRAMQETAWFIYNNDYTSFVLSKIYGRFDEATAAMYERHLCALKNPLKRVASLLSVTYTVPVARDSGSGTINSAVRDHADLLDVALGEAERLKNGVADAFLLPYWDEDAKKVAFSLHPPHEWDPVYKPNLSLDYYEHIPQGVRYYADGWIARKGDDGEWTDREFLYKVCPVVWFRLNPMSKKWSILEIRDLIIGTIEIGMDETLNKLGDYYRSFKQPFLKNAGMTPGQVSEAVKSMRIGMDTLLEREIDTVELSDPKNPHYDQLRMKVADLAASRGISERGYFATEQGLVFSPELRKAWREATKYQLVPEMQLLKAIVAILAKNKILPDSAIDVRWKIDYREPNPDEAEPSKSADILEKKIRLGQDSAVEAILRDDRECVTREDAIAKLKQRAEDRAMLNELMIEHNTADDVASAPTNKTPQENGADGGEMSAQLRAEADGTYDGASGPPLVPPGV